MNEDDNEKPAPKKRGGRLWVWIVLLTVPLIVAVGVAVFFYIQWQEAKNVAPVQLSAEEIGEATQREVDEIVKKLSQLAVLPADETPTLITITDKEEITDNKEFFAAAENGDKVLVYQQARRAFLYRPSAHKIINLAPITLNEDAVGGDIIESPEETLEPTAQATVVLLNGTGASGLTFRFGSSLTEAFADVEITDRENAARANYQASVIVVLDSRRAQLAQDMADQLNLAVEDLPEGEARPAADLLIILGSDQVGSTPETTPVL